MHSASFKSEDFQAAYRDEPLAFCVDCHAPHGSQGVTCTSCHAGTTDHERSGGKAKLESASTSCRGCHEFTTPKARGFLQSTFTEHDESAQSTVACIDCHMKSTRDHRFAVSRDPVFLSAAIRLHDLRRTREGVVVAIAKNNVGHRFPTGDIFRNLFVRAWVEGENGRILGVIEAALHRDWDAFRNHAPEALDTRLGEAPTELVVPLPASFSASTASTARVRVQIEYQRGVAARAGALALFSSLSIADWTRPLPVIVE